MLDRLLGIWSNLLSPQSQAKSNSSIGSPPNHSLSSHQSEGEESLGPQPNAYSRKELLKRGIKQEKAVPEDCIQCRLIGGGGLTALGSYLLYYTLNRQTRATRDRASIVTGTALGLIILGVGLCRLSGVHELLFAEGQGQAKPEAKTVGGAASR